MVRSRTLDDLRQKDSAGQLGQENGPSLPNVFTTELRITHKSKSLLDLKNSKVHFSDNLPQIGKRKDCLQNADKDSDEFSHADSETDHKRKDEEHRSNSVGKKEIGQTNNNMQYSAQKNKSSSRDIAVLRKYPSKLFPKMNALSESYNPVAPVEDAIQAGMEELRNETKEREIKIKEYGSSKKDFSSGQIRTKSTKNLNGKAEDMKKTTKEEEFEDKKEQQVKMMERLVCTLPQKLAETAREQLRQITNVDARYDMKERLRLENREILNQDRKMDERWKNLEESLCETYGISTPWKKVYSKKVPSKKFWMQF